jgi:predicted TIM-barrel fold metal-dependent hydrolase
MSAKFRSHRFVASVIVSIPMGMASFAMAQSPVRNNGQPTAEKAAAPQAERAVEVDTKRRADEMIPFGKPNSDDYLLHDIHFHLTNYVQEGISATKLLELMGDKVGRVAVFGVPLSQKWDFFVTGQRRPGYYLETDSEMYYYSFIDAMTAAEYLRLPEIHRKRFDPFIVGFNPTDMNAKDHIRNVLKTFPGVFVGIGEFSVHKEIVSSKVAGQKASLKNPALDEILKFAAEVGLLVMLHCDIDEMRGTSELPAHLEDLKALFARHPDTTVIYAHTGLGRFVSPKKIHVDLLDAICRDEALKHVHFDISWDETAKWIVKDEQSLSAWADLINRHPTRFLFGTDAVAPKDQAAFLKTWTDYAPLFEKLSPEASRAIRLSNYERLVDTAIRQVRAWESLNLKGNSPLEAKPHPDAKNPATDSVRQIPAVIPGQ